MYFYSGRLHVLRFVHKIFQTDSVKRCTAKHSGRRPQQNLHCLRTLVNTENWKKWVLNHKKDSHNIRSSSGQAYVPHLETADIHWSCEDRGECKEQRAIKKGFTDMVSNSNFFVILDNDWLLGEWKMLYLIFGTTSDISKCASLRSLQTGCSRIIIKHAQ